MPVPRASVAKTRNKNKRRNRKIIKQRKLSEESHDELISIVKHKFGLHSKKSKGELKEPLIDSNNSKIKHPVSYQRIMTRSFESHLNRILQPEAPEDLLPSSWICAICFQPPTNYNTGNIQITSSNSLGELFGPYFVQLAPNFQPPEILVPRQKLEQYKQQNLLIAINTENFADNKCLGDSSLPMTSKKDIMKNINKKNGIIKKITLNGKLDLWFHGECALEVPDLFLIGGRFPNLEHQIARYWASIGIKTNPFSSI